MKDMNNFKKLSDDEQLNAIIAFVRSFPKSEQDSVAEECLGMTIDEAVRLHNMETWTHIETDHGTIAHYKDGVLVSDVKSK